MLGQLILLFFCTFILLIKFILLGLHYLILHIPLLIITLIIRKLIEFMNIAISILSNLVKVVKGEQMIIIDFGALYRSLGIWQKED
ncbi:hypothetical protein pb186bvf_001258 [Paramecium bursaria]